MAVAILHHCGGISSGLVGHLESVPFHDRVKAIEKLTTVEATSAHNGLGLGSVFGRLETALDRSARPQIVT